MRLRHALPVLAGGLLLGWAALGCASLAWADAPPPPAAPIFYCPKPAAAAPAPTPTKAPVVKAHVVHRLACPTEHHVVAVEHRRYRKRYEVRLAYAPPPPPMIYEHAPPPVVYERAPPPPLADRGDVSASQAFIYRYERAMHGLNARAADQAWGAPPPCPGADRCPPPPERRVIIERHELAEAAPPPPRREEYFDRGAPPPVVAPPPCPDRCPEHAPPPVVHEHYEAPPPVIYERHAEAAPPPVVYDRAPPPAEQVYREQGRGYVYERSESEQSSGWRYSDVDGQRHYQQWGDGARAGGCPHTNACGGGGEAAYAEGDARWQDGSYGQVYRYSGRDAYGYLVWPGKTPEAPAP
jgi:hypothetical protein